MSVKTQRAICKNKEMMNTASITFTLKKKLHFDHLGLTPCQRYDTKDTDNLRRVKTAGQLMIIGP